MDSIALGPWPLGIQNVNDVSALVSGALAEAVNVDIDSTGVVFSRDGTAVVTSGVKSVFEYGGKNYCLYNDSVGEFTAGGVTLKYGPGISRVVWGALNDMAVFATPDFVVVCDPAGYRRLGVETPGAVGVLSSAVGSMSAGRYGVAVSYNFNGEEGGLSGVTFVDVAENAGISVVAPYPIGSADNVNVYMTEPNGEVLYKVATAAFGVATPIGGLERQHAAQTQGLAQMPGGSYVRYWRGRMRVARGRTLFFSEPLRYGLYDQTRGFVRFETEVVFVEGVESGVFVGLRDLGVRFLAGHNPFEWQQVLASTVPAQPWCSLSVKTERMDKDLGLTGNAAVWFTDKGFALGANDGRVIFPQTERLSGLPLGTGQMLFTSEDRLTVFSQ